MAVVHLTQENFKTEVLGSDIPVLVDFFADWCGPCKAIAPVIEELSNALAGTCKICKLNIDAAQDLAAQYGVMSIPNLIIFKNGGVAEQMVGAQPKSQLEAFIRKHL